MSRRSDFAYRERRAQELDVIALQFARAGRYEQAQHVRDGALYYRSEQGEATGDRLIAAARMLRVRYHADARRLLGAATWIERRRGRLIDLGDVVCYAAHTHGCGFSVYRGLLERKRRGEDVAVMLDGERLLADAYRYDPQDAFWEELRNEGSTELRAEDRVADLAFGALDALKAGIGLPQIALRYGVTMLTLRRVMAEQVRWWTVMRVDFLDDPGLLADIQADLTYVHAMFGWRPRFTALKPLSEASLRRWREDRVLPMAYRREFAKFPASGYVESFALSLPIAQPEPRPGGGVS